jgi:VWFA-related protein
MPRSLAVRALASTLSAALLASSPVAAPAADRAPQFGSEITLVSLPVFVTDGEGRSVSGLTQADFEVTEDGRMVPVVGFREVDAGAPGNVESMAPPESPAARRQFLLLFDLSFSSVNGLVRSRAAALDFIAKGMSASDLGAVATFTANHGVRLLVGFTSDRGQLRRAVATLGVLQLDRRADPLGLAYDLSEVGMALSDTLPEEGGGALQDALRAVALRYQRSQEAEYRQKVVSLLEGMEELAKALDAVQGRKQVILLSSGFNDTALTGEQGAQAMQDSEAVVRGRLWEVQSENRFGDTQVRQQLQQMARRFSGSDALVHTVDLSGLAARGDMAQAGAEAQRRSGREALSEIANLSGGRIFKDTNDVGLALGEIAELSRRYYVLAFEPAGARGAGRFHKLKVRVKRKGLDVSHRSGYYERAAFAERAPLARRFEAAELIAKGVEADALPLRTMAMPYRTAAGTLALPVVVDVAGDRLLAGAKSTLGVEVYGYALDPTGAIEDFVALASNLDLAKTADRLRDGGLQAHATFALKPGRHVLRFLVRDSETGRTGSQSLEIELPPFDPAEVVVLPPLVMDRPDRGIVLEARSPSLRGVPSPFSVGDEAFAPRIRPTLRNGAAEKLVLMAFDGGRQYDPGASFDLRPALVDGEGAPVAGIRFSLVKATAGDDGFRRFVLGFTPSGVAAGDYRLRVRLRDPSTGRTSESYQAVRVE